MKSKILLLVLLLVSTFGFSQKIEISGKVLDSKTNMPIPGVNVTVKSSKLGITTDLDGNFKFGNLTSGDVLLFSYIGYTSSQYKVTTSEIISIKLVEDNKTLEEVVVVGYGTKKKKDVTGSVSVLSSKTIEQLRPIKVEQALQGTVAGVSVTSDSGSPGAGLNIRVRGIGTNGNANATILIDGVPGDIGLLSPDDIDSITVLKDAQAAVYGTVGANGIVLVTTKQGKKNSKTKVTFNTYTGMQQTTKKINVLNATEYALMLNEAYANDGQALPYPNASGLGKGTDWQNEVFKKTPIVSNDFSISGGSDKVTYTLSGSDLQQEGIVGGSKSAFKRNTARLSLGADLSPKFKIQSTVGYSFIKRNSLSENGLGSVLFNAINSAPTQSVYDANGNYTLVPNTTGYGVEVINPLAQIDNTYNDYNIKKLYGNVKLTYDVLKDFKITSRIGFNTSNSIGKAFYKIVDYGGKVFDVTRSSVNQSTVNDNDFTYDLFGEYDKTFFINHKLKVTAGTTIYKTWGSGLFATGYDVPNNSWDNADISLTTGISTTKDNGSYGYDDRRLSYFSMMDYSFKGKYLLSGSIRRDESSFFGPDRKRAYFPSILGGWVVSEESFFKKNNTFNFMKIRASYGILGNDQIGSNRYRGNVNGAGTYVFDGNLTIGSAQGVLPNPQIQWEQAKKLDIGADFRFYKNKIDITTDYFHDLRDDLLIPSIPVSGITGVYGPGSGSPTANAGSVLNKGLEFSINYKDKLSENWSFTVGYNITKIKNVVTAVNNSTGYIEGGSFGVGQLAPTRMEVGHPIGYFYGYQMVGIFQNQAEINAAPSQAALGSATAPGDIRFKDVNGDGVIDQRDRTDIGKYIPDYTMGMNLNLNYKNFDFIAYAYSSIGNKMIRNYERAVSNLNKLNYTLGAWSGDGSTNSDPRVTAGASNNNIFSSYYVEDASYLRLQNIQLGYTISKKVTQSVGIEKVRLYAAVTNVYTFTKYRGYDPAATSGDVLSGGIDYGFYPTPKTYMFGLNLNF